jgi:hypothetical protein
VTNLSLILLELELNGPFSVRDVEVANQLLSLLVLLLSLLDYGNSILLRHLLKQTFRGGSTMKTFPSLLLDFVFLVLLFVEFYIDRLIYSAEFFFFRLAITVELQVQRRLSDTKYDSSF